MLAHHLDHFGVDAVGGSGAGGVGQVATGCPNANPQWFPFGAYATAARRCGYLTIRKPFCFGTDAFLDGSVAVPLSR
jgi:hypothetical protein